MISGKYEIKEVQVYEEDGSYFLSIKYITENDRLIEEIEIPKLDLCLSDSKYRGKSPNIDYRDNSPLGSELCYFHTGLGISYRMLPGTTSDKANHTFYTVKTLKEKTHKMTVSEIERKLGYKIEIVSEKEK